MLVGLAAFVAGLLVLGIQPLRRLGRRQWIASRRAGTVQTRAPTGPLARARLRRIDTLISALIPVAFGAIVLYQVVPGEFGLLLTGISFTCLAVLAFVRARLRGRFLPRGP